MSSLRWIGRDRPLVVRELLAATAFSFAANAFSLASPLFMLEVYDRVLPSRSGPTLAVLALLVVVLLTSMALLDAVRGRLLTTVACRIEQALAPGLTRAAIRLAAAPGGGRLLPVSAELRSITRFLSGPGAQALLDLPWLPLFLLIIWLMHPTLGFLALLGAVSLVVLAIVGERLLRRHVRETTTLAVESQRAADDMLHSAEAVQALGMTEGLVEASGRRNARSVAAQRASADLSGVLQSFGKWLRYVLQAALLAAGAWMVVQQEATAGVMIACTILFGRALAPVEQIVAGWTPFLEARAAWQRIAALPPGLSVPEPARTPLPPVRGSLEFRDVTLVLRQRETPALDRVNFALGAGTVLGVIGPSASGKTTLSRLACGAWSPTSGEVLLDGAALELWPADQRHAAIGYLPQGIQLLPGTVAQNISRFTSGDQRLVVQAAQRASCHSMILALPDGYETRIDALGDSLTPGQRQRIGLARALYGSPRLVVLDEPNASLDSAGEQALREAIVAMRGAGVTTILVSHKPALIRLADRVLVLREGRVEQEGERDAVLTLLDARRAIGKSPSGPARILGSGGTDVA